MTELLAAHQRGLLPGDVRERRLEVLDRVAAQRAEDLARRLRVPHALGERPELLAGRGAVSGQAAAGAGEQAQQAQQHEAPHCAVWRAPCGSALAGRQPSKRSVRAED